MNPVSRYRTVVQNERIRAAESVGYKWERDSDYKLKDRGIVKRGCLSILFGKPHGRERAMIVYPDGSVETQEPKRGGSTGVTFNRDKLTRALSGYRKPLRDEDSNFMEGS